MEQGEDPRVIAVKEWIADHQQNDPDASDTFTHIIGALESTGKLTQRLTSPQLRSILESLGMKVGKRDNQLHCFGVLGYLNPENAAASILPCVLPQPKTTPPRGGLSTKAVITGPEKGVKGT